MRFEWMRKPEGADVLMQRTTRWRREEGRTTRDPEKIVEDSVVKDFIAPQWPVYVIFPLDCVIVLVLH